MRVATSTVVRMNSASNMSAKWYQSFMAASPPMMARKMLAMPMANVGAPPVRASTLFSPMAAARALIWSAPTGNPHADTAWATALGVLPTKPAGAFTAKYTPGSRTHAAIMAMMATKLSRHMAP
jgi:hypothetical protein